MKRVFLCFIFLSVMISLVLADQKSAESSFIVSAYKLVETNTDEPIEATLEITDAISEELTIVNEGEKINLDSVVYDLLGTPETSENESPEKHVVFSYRVFGNMANTYTLTFTMGAQPFIKDGDTSVHYWGNRSIDHAYGILHRHYGVNKTFENQNNYIPIEDETFTPIIKGSYAHDNTIENGDGTLGQAGTPGDELKIRFTTKETQSLKNGIVWVARGVIAMTISLEDYEKAISGTYTLPVSVKLEVL